MNKMILLFAPVLAAGIVFGVSRASFSKSGVPDKISQTASYDRLSEKGEKLLNREIIDPLRSKKEKRVKTNMYSRCPSGMTYYLTEAPSAKQPHFVGEVIDRMGCESLTVCFFRIDRNEEVLEAKTTEEGEYLPVAEWKKEARRPEWSF